MCGLERPESAGLDLRLRVRTVLLLRAACMREDTRENFVKGTCCDFMLATDLGFQSGL